ncbi:MAG TPA: S53 family peptidase [Streptosporangiaceae bacterium]|jgi:subtilase family serine protease
MKAVRWLALTGTLGLAVSFTAATAGAATASAKPGPASHRIDLRGSMAPAKARAHPAGSIAATSQVSFDLMLTLRNAAGAQAFVKQVSSPGSALFHHYLSDAAWGARFGPTQAEVAKAKSWLRQSGFTVGAVPKDRLFVSASGTVRSVERAFGIKLGYYMVNGKRVRLASGTLTIPSSLGGTVSGAVGVNEYLATTGLAPRSAAAAVSHAAPSGQPPPVAAFDNPQPCAKFWGQKPDTADNPALYAPFTAPLPYDICGYLPSQLRSAYGLTKSVAAGNDGSGVTIAIVDAYDSPTLRADAQRYARQNDPSHLLKSSQFIDGSVGAFDDAAECGSGWYSEQALDVESSHAIAPGANIFYAGAKDCQNTSLLNAVNTAITSGASVVTDSWGSALGDLLEDAASHTAFDNTFMLADATGVSVMFSSGDDGDNFADFGMTVPDYPATSPFITAVGGTTLEINRAGARAAEYGWSVAKQTLCASATTNCGSATVPAGSLNWQAGGGGGTSFFYTQPFYQAGVVPSALALRNEALFGPVPLRVIPDISMDADAQSGMLIGLHEQFPNGVRYNQFKEGGTSLASPLLAGVVADADQAAGVSLGFLNPELYKASTDTPAAFNDILPPASPDSAAVIRVDFINAINASNGFVMSLRTINYAGPETFCDGTGNCATRNVTITAAPGFDGLTGIGSVGRKFVSTMSKF